MFLGIYVMNENTNQTCQLLSAKELSKILSTQKSLPEELAAELIAIWIYSQSPILCQAEYKQALRLFESTLRKYLVFKNFDGLRGFNESSTTDSGTSTVAAAERSLP